MRKELADTLLRGGMSALIVFATIMLGVGEESVALTLTTLVAVATSVYITDLRKSFHLTQTVADCVAMGVVIVSAANMLYIDRAGQIGAVASLQSYLQYVLLFQPKTPRVYWQLGLLSLGQVAIAATLVPGPMFGAMLLAYLLIGFAAFTLLILRAEASRYASPQPTANLAPALASAVVTRPSAGRAPQLRGSVAAKSGGLRWGLLEPIATMCLVTFIVTTLLFFFIPRRDVDKRQVPSNEPLRSVGFSKTITLGELGEVVQNPDVVMRIEFFRGRNVQPLQLADEPLLRGTVVTRYEDGAWTQPQSAGVVTLSRKITSPYVRQRITIEPMDVAELFCVNPVFALHPDRRLRLNGSSGQLIRQEDYQSQRMTFEVGTTGIRNNRMRKFFPRKRPLNEFDEDRLIEMPVASEGDSDPFSGLRETAARVLRESDVDPRNRVATARALHDYLRFSGRYTYSLEWQPRERNLDPLEDFVTQHPAGHCEYFAGALVMMLRSQGIPARMAIGFKGGEWNPLGMYYQVQQLHAHTWVEAYLTKEDIPADAFDDDEGTPAAAWFILDPTVSVEDGDGLDRRTGLLARLRHSIDYAQVLWSKYIVGLNSERQQEGIYEPIWAGAQAAYQNLFGPEIWSQRFRAVARSPLGAFWEWYRRHWFSWRGGLVAIGASLVIATCYFGVRAAAVALRRWGVPLGRQRPQEPPTLEMYRRLEAALARQGFQRTSAQTAREFAAAVGGHLAESIELNRVSHLPRRIVESFYRVRFGGRTLDNREAKAVEHALGDLERALARHR